MLLYRRGSKFPDNLCPRPGLDGDGLSTFDSLERAVDPGEKAQVIDTGKLQTLLAVPSQPPPGWAPPDGRTVRGRPFRPP